MFIIRAARVAHGMSDAARALACLEALRDAGQAATVTDARGRRLDAADLRSLAGAAVPQASRSAGRA